MNKTIDIDIQSLFFQSQKPTLHSIHLSFNKGDSIAFIGESGAGKSTLMKLLSGYTHTHNIEAQLNVFGEKYPFHIEQRTKEQRSVFGYIDQNYYESINEHKKIKHTLKEIFYTQPFSCIQKKFLEYCQQFHLSPSILQSAPYELSGGMRQRVFIALSLIRDIQVLCMDEIISALDTELRKQILSVIFAEVKKRNLTCFIVDHHFDLIQPYISQAILIDQGSILEKSKKNNNKSFFFYSQIGQSIQNGLSTLKRVSYTIKQDKPLLKLQNVSIQYSKHSPLINNLSLSLYKQEIIGIYGPSGIGKTSLSNCLTGLLPSKGKIFYQNKEISHLKDFSPIQPVFQQTWSSFFEHLTIRKQLSLYLKKQDNPNKIIHYFRELSLSLEILDRKPHQLSGGECQRLSFVRTLLLHPKIIILDEPTASLDIILKKKLIDICHLIRKRFEISMILFSHNKTFLKALSSRLFKIEQQTCQEVDF